MRGGCDNDRMQPIEQVVEMLAEGTAGLVASASQLTDGQARGPSLLPGWRSSVAHLAWDGAAELPRLPSPWST